jgi:hypothetical protein
MTFKGLLSIISPKTELFTTTAVIIPDHRALLAGFSLDLFFDHEDGGNMFLRHVR